MSSRGSKITSLIGIMISGALLFKYTKQAIEDKKRAEENKQYEIKQEQVNQQKKKLDFIDNKISIDLNVDSFETTQTDVKYCEKANAVKVNGIAIKNGNLDCNAYIVYKIPYENYERINSYSNSDGTKTRGGFNNIFLENLYEGLKSEKCIILETKCTLNEQITIDVGSANINDETNTVDYSVRVLKYNNKTKNLDVNNYYVSAPVTKELKENPSKVYLLNKDQYSLNSLGNKTYTDVSYITNDENDNLIMY